LRARLGGLLVEKVEVGAPNSFDGARTMPEIMEAMLRHWCRDNPDVQFTDDERAKAEAIFTKWMAEIDELAKSALTIAILSCVPFVSWTPPHPATNWARPPVQLRCKPTEQDSSSKICKSFCSENERERETKQKYGGYPLFFDPPGGAPTRRPISFC
jgi:hypothetical protein